MSDRVPAIKVLLLPQDTNALGTIFGGVILAHVDLASAVEACKTAPLRCVTKALREVEFHTPVFVGDKRVQVTEAEVVLVAIGADGQPTPIARS